MKNVNAGHRARLRERMMKEGLSSFQDHEVLEMLLFQYLPRKDTNKIAHDLINTFGSFANVLDASPEQLKLVDGVSVVTACNLATLKEVFHRYARTKGARESLQGISSLIKYSQKLMSISYIEKMVVVYVDGASYFLHSDEFTSVSNQSINIDIKKIMSSAVNVDAKGVLLFHCHVDGACSPSPNDYRFTEKTFVALASINVVILDHMIFSRDEYYSMFREGDMAVIGNKYKAISHQGFTLQ